MIRSISKYQNIVCTQGHEWTLNWANSGCICSEGQYLTYDSDTNNHIWTKCDIENWNECPFSNSCSKWAQGYFLHYNSQNNQIEWKNCIENDLFMQDCSQCFQSEGKMMF